MRFFVCFKKYHFYKNKKFLQIKNKKEKERIKNSVQGLKEKPSTKYCWQLAKKNIFFISLTKEFFH